MALSAAGDGTKAVRKAASEYGLSSAADPFWRLSTAGASGTEGPRVTKFSTG